MYPGPRKTWEPAVVLAPVPRSSLAEVLREGLAEGWHPRQVLGETERCAFYHPPERRAN